MRVQKKGMNFLKTYVDEGDVELLGRVAALQVAPHVHVVVLDDAGDDVGGGDAVRALGGHEHACGRPAQGRVTVILHTPRARHHRLAFKQSVNIEDGS